MIKFSANPIHACRPGKHWLTALTAALWLACSLPALAEDELKVEPINVNEASAELLAELPGIGPSKADAIIAEREAHGPYKDLEDLTRVKGVGQNTVARLADEIRFSNAD